jgi:hypothetical protein
MREGCGRTRIGMRLSGSRPLDRNSRIHCSTNGASRGPPRISEEHTYSRKGLSSGSPTRRQNAARSVDGCRSNHWSKHCAPVTTIRSAGTRWKRIASSRWTSFHTNTLSGMLRMMALLDR